MLSYRDMTIDSFDGGLTDRIIDRSFNTFEVLNNFVVTKDKDLAVRRGRSVYKSGASVLSVCKFLFRNDSGNLMGLASTTAGGTKMIYENEQGQMVSGSVIDSSIGAEESLSSFNWKGINYITSDIKNVGLSVTRFHLYSLYMWTRAQSGSAITYTPEGEQVGCPDMQWDGTINGNAGSYNLRYLLVYKQQVVVNGGLDSEVTQDSYGKSFRLPVRTDLAEPSATNVTKVDDIYTASKYDDYSSNPMVELYRTTNNDATTFYFVGNVVPNTTATATVYINDSVSDAELVKNSRFYESEGITPMSQPPKHSCSTMINGTAFYGNISVNTSNIGYIRQYEDFGYKVMQSMVGNPTMVNESFVMDFDDVVKGMSSIGKALIVFTETKIYRVDGVINNDNSGGHSIKEISADAGCISSRAIVKVNNQIFFMGSSGIYVTDGYNFSNISLTEKYDITETYLGFIADSTIAGTSPYITRTKVKGTFDKYKNRIYWTMCSGSKEPNKLLVYDLSNRLFSTMDAVGGIFDFVLIENDNMFTADDNSNIFLHQDNNYSDVVPDQNETDSSLWVDTYIDYRAKLTSTDFGLKSIKKWVQSCTSVIDATTNVSINLISYNDNSSSGKDLKYINKSDTMFWRDRSLRWRDPSMIWRPKQVSSFKRHFPKRGLRCRFKQLEISPVDTEIYNSSYSSTVSTYYIDPNNPNPTKFYVRFDEQTTDGTTLREWPSDIVNYVIKFSSDNYTVGHVIREVNNSSPQYIIIDGGLSGLLNNVDYKIEGVRKKQSFKVESITYKFAPLDNVGAEYGGDNV